MNKNKENEFCSELIESDNKSYNKDNNKKVTINQTLTPLIIYKNFLVKNLKFIIKYTNELVTKLNLSKIKLTSNQQNKILILAYNYKHCFEDSLKKSRKLIKIVADISTILETTKHQVNMQ